MFSGICGITWIPIYINKYIKMLVSLSILLISYLTHLTMLSSKVVCVLGSWYLNSAMWLSDFNYFQKLFFDSKFLLLIFVQEVCFMLPPLLSLLLDCAKQTDQSVVSLSLGALVHLIEVGGHQFSESDWDMLLKSIRCKSLISRKLFAIIL